MLYFYIYSKIIHKVNMENTSIYIIHKLRVFTVDATWKDTGRKKISDTTV